MRRSPKVWFATFAAAITLIAVAPAAFAQTADKDVDTLSIRKVDSTDLKAVKVSIFYNGARDDLTGITVREDGREVETTPVVPLAKAGVHTASVYVIDTSRSMGRNGGVTQVKASIASAIDDLDPGDAIGIVSFDSEARTLVELTTSKSEARAGLADLVAPPSGKTALWAGVKRGAAMFAAQPDLQPNLVVVSDGFDDSSTTAKNAARTEVSRSGAAVFALAYNQQNQVDSKALSGLVEVGGGRLFSAPKTEDLAKSLDTVRTSLANQFMIEYASNAQQGATSLTVNVAGETDTKTFVPGAVAQGNNALSPPTVPDSIVPDFLTTGAGKVVALGAVALAVALGVFAVGSLIGKEDTTLENVLMPYTDGQSNGEDVDEGALAQTALLQRAVEMTEDFAERQGFLKKVENRLEQANLPLRAAEAIFFWAAGAVILTLLALVLGGLMGFVAGLLIFGYFPVVVVKFLAKKRQKAFNAQLPDMLQLLSGSLRAGYSLMQGVEAVSQEVSEPMGRELRRVCTEARLGRELEESMDGVAERMNSADFEWAVMAIRIQREVGGNLAELLNTVGETMVERERLRREVAALTAEGKISAIVLGILPPAIGAVMWVVNPEYTSVLFNDSLGKALSVAGIVMALVGFAWMKKTITIEI